MSLAFTSSASIWKPWLPSVMSGPLSEASARFTTATMLLKSLKVRFTLTFGYFCSNCFVSSVMTGIRPGSWLSYDQTSSLIGPSDSKPSVFTVGAAAAVLPAAPEVSLAAGAAGVELLVVEPGVPPHAATTRPTAMAASAAVVPLRIRTLLLLRFTAGGRASRGTGTGRPGSGSAPARPARRLHRTPPSPPPARGRPGGARAARPPAPVREGPRRYTRPARAGFRSVRAARTGRPT